MYKNMFFTSSKIKSAAISFGFLCVLTLFILFSWRVFTFYRQIENGGLDISSLKFNSTKLDSSSLLALARQAPGTGQLATADDPSLGPADAPITIVEFADFGCPFSAEEHFVVRAIQEAFPNDVRIVFRDFPVTELHEGALLAAIGGECAAEQGKFWSYHDQVFSHSAELTEELLISYADDAGVDVPRFSSCLSSLKYNDEVLADLTDGITSGVRGTPTFFINGVKVEGNVPFSIFKDLIHAFLEA